MSAALLIEQLLNGLQLGVMLFLIAAGLTLIFGVMGLINLAHGSLYMVGAFACAVTAAANWPRAAAWSRASRSRSQDGAPWSSSTRWGPRRGPARAGGRGTVTIVVGLGVVRK